VNHRWLGGTLTNWATLQKSIKRLKLLKAMNEDGRIKELSKKEQARLDREMKHLFQNLEGIENMTQLPDAMFRDRFQRGRDCRQGSAAHGRARGFRLWIRIAIRTWWTGSFPETTTRCAPFACSRRRLRIPCRKATTAYQQSQVAEQKAAEDQALVDGVEYVDTSAYEQYEKQEGDFVEGVVETPAEPAEIAEAAEATVPPDDEKTLNIIARVKSL